MDGFSWSGAVAFMEFGYLARRSIFSLGYHGDIIHPISCLALGLGNILRVSFLLETGTREGRTQRDQA